MKKVLFSAAVSLAILIAGLPSQALSSNSWQGVNDDGQPGFTFTLDSDSDFYYFRMDLEDSVLSSLVDRDSLGFSLEQMGMMSSYGAEFRGTQEDYFFQADSTDYGFSSGASHLEWKVEKNAGESFWLNAYALVGEQGYFETGDVQATPTPIPGALWLMASGLVALIGLRRRKA